eukprot:1651718-Lingulodinium_polyedra.AAC.1
MRLVDAELAVVDGHTARSEDVANADEPQNSALEERCGDEEILLVGGPRRCAGKPLWPTACRKEAP